MGEQITYSLPEAIEQSTAGTSLTYLDKAAFDALSSKSLPSRNRTALFAQMARFNTLYMIARAGSGHLGSSFSSLDIVSWLYLNVLGPSDRYYSSKGHDSPGLYAVHTALGILPFDKIHALRRLNGLTGHPDVGTAGAFTNTGSLGMGISKAKGFLFADDLLGRPKGRVFVMTGDGELQEGQLWESLVSAARRRDGRLVVIVDHNKVQSDTHVDKVSDLGDLEAKFRAFGWDTYRCDGHDFVALERLLGTPGAEGRPKMIIADTIKGRGVSFMEHTAMTADQPYYRFHSGAPTPSHYRDAANELLASIRMLAGELEVELAGLQTVQIEPLSVPSSFERMIPAYSEAIVAEAKTNPRLVALDADLVLDTGLIPFKDEFPDRFVECGIAEQDMVSQAGTMALGGALPIVHSFACFLTTRPSEQIYNNATEGSKIIYVGSLAGLLPGGPGHSHQSVRDITAMAAMPGLVMLEPVNGNQLKQAFAWAAQTNPKSTYLRLTSIPYEVRPELDALGALQLGQGTVLRRGDALTVVVTGPILLTQALKAADLLSSSGIELQIITTPWLNRVDAQWYESNLGPKSKPLVTLENHYVEHGFGVSLVSRLAEQGALGGRTVRMLGLTAIPACGRNDEVLRHHQLDAESLASTLRKLVEAR